MTTRVTLTQDVINHMVNQFRNGSCIPELMMQYGWGRNKITWILRKELGNEYTSLARNISIARLLEGGKRSKRNLGKRYGKSSKLKMPRGLCRQSRFERTVFSEIQKIWPDAVHSFKLITPTKNRVFYDVMIPHLKLIIEINGDFWHFNPEMYQFSSYDHTRKMFAIDCWDFDNAKLCFAQRQGYQTRVLWESDLNVPKERLTQVILDIVYDSDNRQVL